MKRRSSPPRKGTYENPIALRFTGYGPRPNQWYILKEPTPFYKKALTDHDRYGWSSREAIIHGELGTGTRIFVGNDGKCRVSRFTPTKANRTKKVFYSWWKPKYRYKLGKEARVHRIDKRPITCSHGIHGFLTYGVALRWRII